MKKAKEQPEPETSQWTAKQAEAVASIVNAITLLGEMGKERAQTTCNSYKHKLESISKGIQSLV